jgi:hypothetical protein
LVFCLPVKSAVSCGEFRNFTSHLIFGIIILLRPDQNSKSITGIGPVVDRPVSVCFQEFIYGSCQLGHVRIMHGNVFSDFMVMHI